MTPRVNDIKKLECFKKLFIGNLRNYAVQKKNGIWTVIKNVEITNSLIQKHLTRELTMGSYYAYKHNHVERCKWICLDLDLHSIELQDNITIDNSIKIKDVKFPTNLKGKKTIIKNAKILRQMYWEKSGLIIYELKKDKGKYIKNEKYRIEANELDKLEEFAKDVSFFLSKFYNIPTESICRERSGRGLHIWIFLSDNTTLKNAYLFKNDILNKLKEFYGVECEITPKQPTLKGLKMGLGNFVKLPLSINNKCGIFCEILDDFDLSKAELFDVSHLVKIIRKNTTLSKKIIKRETEIDLSKWTPIDNKNYKMFYDELRPCLKKIVDGKRFAIGTYGHEMRIALVNDLFKLRTPLEGRILSFQNQPDFDPEKSRLQSIYLEIGNIKKNSFMTSSCKTITKRGYCLSDCPMLDKARIELTTEEYDLVFKKRKNHGITGGWVEERKIYRNIINENKQEKYYLEKTTRSGATTGLIIEAINNQKKILVIAPTIRICEITIKKALELSNREPNLFRFGNNRELCLSLFQKAERIPELKKFPFLLRDNCELCRYASFISCKQHNKYHADCEDCVRANKNREKCKWRIAIEDINDYDIIYITIAKLFNLTKIKSADSRKILNKIKKMVDINFLDEASRILSVGNDGLTFMTEADPVYKHPEKKINFPKLFKYEYDKLIPYMEQNLTYKQKGIWHGLYDFVKEIQKIHKSWKPSLKNNTFYKLNSPLYKILRDLDKWYIKKNKFGSGDKDWLNLYKTIIKYVENGGKKPHAIIDILLLARYPQFYIQYTNPIRYNVKMEIFPAKPIKEFLDFVNEISEVKLFFTTDATEPPIPIEKMFTGIKKIIINDPMGTAEKQTIHPYPRSINISRPNFLKFYMDEIYRFIDKYGTDNTMIICQNRFVHGKLIKLLNRKKHYKVMTYFRSSLTIGTPSSCRRILTIGSPYPPRDSSRWLADLFLKEKIVDENEFNINNLTKHLEYYDAKSTFFQSISRAKDPEGIVKSDVFCFGLNRYQIQHLLNFPIAVPKIAMETINIEKTKRKIKI